MKSKSDLLLRTFSVLWFAASSTVWAFDPTKVPDGLYYNGTNVDEQLWTPLMLAREGLLIDPFVFAQKNGVKALEGSGQTTMLNAVTPFLYGGCTTQTRLLSNPPLVADVSTPYVANFVGKDCQRQRDIAFENYRRSVDQRGDNPFPTFYINQPDHGMGLIWSYSVPGQLVGKNIPVNAYTESDIGAKPWPVNGVVSRMSFIPLPVIEPDLIDIALAEKKPLPKYPVPLSEVVHRGDKVTVSSELLNQAQAAIKDRLWDLYYPRLAQALQGKFGGIRRSYFELGLIQGVDLDNKTSFDYAGVARIGVVTQAGPSRWVDVIYCWRPKDNSFSVIATSEDALYKDEHLFFSEKFSSLWSPSLVISGFSDFDKDKQLEFVISQIRPVASIVQLKGGPASNALNLRQSYLYTWSKSDAGGLNWHEVYRTVIHEARSVWEDPANVRIDLFGQ